MIQKWKTKKKEKNQWKKQPRFVWIKKSSSLSRKLLEHIRIPCILTSSPPTAPPYRSHDLFYLLLFHNPHGVNCTCPADLSHLTSNNIIFHYYLSLFGNRIFFIASAASPCLIIRRASIVPYAAPQSVPSQIIAYCCHIFFFKN